ncbi:MAG: hypothetical protein NT075_18640 [Chloroflexi bacterium]|nr:hypothetical protein [Chloroflexota bacterium]
MKHCPNPVCPFLKEYKLVAEFNDNVEVCRDCGTQLVAGDAPDVVVAESARPTTAYQPILAENQLPDLVTLCAVDSEADAEFYKAQLEFQDIPVAIVRETVPTEDEPDEPATLLFELQVRRSDLMRATYLLDTLDSETDDTQLDGELYDESLAEDDKEDDEEDEDDEVDPQWAELDADDEPESALSATPGRESSTSGNMPAAASMAGTPLGAADAKPTNRSSQTLLLIVLAVIVILIVWFLLNR